MITRTVSAAADSGGYVALAGSLPGGRAAIHLFRRADHLNGRARHDWHSSQHVEVLTIDERIHVTLSPSMRDGHDAAHSVGGHGDRKIESANLARYLDRITIVHPDREIARVH